MSLHRWSCSAVRHVGGCAVRRRVRGSLARADGAIESGRSRAEDLLETIRPALLRAIAEAENEVTEAVSRARAAGGEVLGAVRLPRRPRSRRLPAILGIATLAAAGAAVAAILMRRRSTPEAAPAPPPAAPAE